MLEFDDEEENKNGGVKKAAPANKGKLLAANVAK